MSGQQFKQTISEADGTNHKLYSQQDSFINSNNTQRQQYYPSRNDLSQQKYELSNQKTLLIPNSVQFTDDSNNNHYHSRMQRSSTQDQYAVTSIEKKFTESNSQNNESQDQQSNSQNFGQNNDYQQKKDQCSLYQVKQHHKQIAIKLNILTNRINNLSQEDCHLKKKAEDYRQKAEKIYEAKRREQIKKEEAKQQRAIIQEIPFTHPVGQIELAKIKLSKQYVLDKHKEEARLMKIRMAKENQKKIKQLQKNSEEVQQKVHQVKVQESISKKKLNQYYQRRQEQAKQEQANALEREIKMKDQKEEILRQLERMEAEQLNQLNETKQRTRQAQNQLEFLKNNNPRDYEEKFGSSSHREKETKAIKGFPASQFQNQAAQYYLVEDKFGQVCIRSDHPFS